MLPDPLFMALRSAFSNGPLGWFARRFDAWREAREYRREMMLAVTAADDHLRSFDPSPSRAEYQEPPADLAA